jgi:hypothetical protein
LENHLHRQQRRIHKHSITDNWRRKQEGASQTNPISTGLNKQRGDSKGKENNNGFKRMKRMERKVDDILLQNSPFSHP